MLTNPCLSRMFCLWVSLRFQYIATVAKMRQDFLRPLNQALFFECRWCLRHLASACGGREREQEREREWCYPLCCPGENPSCFSAWLFPVCSSLCSHSHFAVCPGHTGLLVVLQTGPMHVLFYWSGCPLLGTAC